LKVLLDTTYILPAIGIAIKEVSSGIALKLNSKGHEIAVSEITLFELSAKGAKYIMSRSLSPERVAAGIRSILYDESVQKIPTYNTAVLLTAFSLRSLMTDFIDCLILSTALNHCDVLVTEDQIIHGLKKNEQYLKIQSALNQKFRIKTIAEMQKS
jgi:predicted nucleic acid-binding protein